MPAPPALSRRAALGGAVAATAALASACTPGARPHDGGAVPRATSPAASPPPEPDVALAVAALRSEQAVLGRVLATLHAHPRLDQALRSARHAHQSHVRLLAGAVPAGASAPAPATPTGTATGTPTGTATGTPTGTSTGTSTGTTSSGASPARPSTASGSPTAAVTGARGGQHRRVDVPAHPRAALRALATAELRLAASGRESSLHARSGQFAGLLAGMAASAAQQGAQLTTAAARTQ